MGFGDWFDGGSRLGGELGFGIGDRFRHDHGFVRNDYFRFRDNRHSRLHRLLVGGFFEGCLVNRRFSGLGRSCGRTNGLDEPRRSQRGSLRLWRLGLLARHHLLGALRRWTFREHVAAWQLNVALARQALDELPSDDFFDGARRAAHLDAVIALQKRHHFLTRRSEQLSDFVNPNCGQLLPRGP